jgi:hypothetical protein
MSEMPREYQDNNEAPFPGPSDAVSPYEAMKHPIIRRDVRQPQESIPQPERPIIYPKNTIYSPDIDPERSDAENLAAMTPGQVRMLTIAGSLTLGQLGSDSIDPEILRTMEPGDEMCFRMPHPVQKDVERLDVIMHRNTAGIIVHRDNAITGLQRLGLLRSGSEYEDYRKRDVVTIYSEPHGAVLFAFDTDTGRRFMPQNTEGIDPTRGWSISALSQVADLEDKFKLPAWKADR